jgi:phosphatidate phosphatase APP1
MKKVPALLNFYGLSNGKMNLFTGQLSYTFLNDLTFQQYSRRKTFWTLLGLYRSRAAINQEVELRFDQGTVKTKTDLTGSFWCTAASHGKLWVLQDVILTTGKSVVFPEDLYTRSTHLITTPAIAISDIDDTLLHSHIRNSVRKFRTLMFTTMENRKAVRDMHDLIKRLDALGATPFYLSNSEQNLYPLIYRFLTYNDFPPGPLFLKQWRTMRGFFIRHKRATRNAHKLATLENIMAIFPEKKYILVGDNTQQDIPIYLQTAEKFPDKIKYVLIRKVYDKAAAVALVKTAEKRLSELNIGFHYASTFSSALSLTL